MNEKKKKHAEQMRAFRQRQKNKKPPKKAPKTGAERVREYRARRARREALEEHGGQPNLPSTSNVLEASMSDDALSEDLLNYPYWKLMGGPKIIKKGVVPRFFDCQSQDPPPEVSDPLDPLRTTTDIVLNNASNFFIGSVHSVNDEFILPDDNGIVVEETTPPTRTRVSSFNIASRGTQTMKIRTCAKNVQVKPKFQTAFTNTESSIPSVETNDSPCNDESSIRSIGRNDSACNDESSFKMETYDIAEEFPESLDPFNGHCSTMSTDNEQRLKILTETIYDTTTRLLIETNPMNFIGLPKENLSLIDELSLYTELSKKTIHMILKKIRQDTPYSVLSSYFGTSESTVVTTMRNDLPKIANYLGHCIVWPTDNEMRINLPLQLRERYGRIYSIIDFFEVRVDEPEFPMNKTDCENTRKYLISITPDGIINYISNGYNGNITNIQIIENSNYLSVLPSGVAVLTDRDYKSIEILTRNKKCTIIKPPINLVDLKSTEREVITTKVDSVRDYVQTVVRKLREFRMLEHHAIMDKNMFDQLDNAVIVAAALYNLMKKSVT